jgi:uncharacterized 2Fe-2S/4Fe-4S cluster protein (DUF4445 family)
MEVEIASYQWHDESNQPEIQNEKFRHVPWLKIAPLTLTPPRDGDNQSDCQRLQLALDKNRPPIVPWELLEDLPATLRRHNWRIDAWLLAERVIHLAPADLVPYELAVDLGTTSIWMQLLDARSGRVVGESSGFNRQSGEDVISRIAAAAGAGGKRQQQAAIASINQILEPMLARLQIKAEQVALVMLAGNTIMSHLLLGLDCRYLRLAPYVPVTGHYPVI